MNAGRFALSPMEADVLHAQYPAAPDQSWVPACVQAEGWQAANTLYLQQERARYADAMRALLDALHVEGPASTDEAVDLIVLAYEVFMPDVAASRSLVRRAGNELHVFDHACPTLALMEAQRGLGVTACASWHRRSGWLDALCVLATNSLLSEQRWGSPACVSVIRVEAVPQRRAA